MTEKTLNYAELQAENERLKAEVAKARAEERKGYINSLIDPKKAKIFPISAKSLGELLEFAERYDSGEKVEFSEGENLTQKIKAFIDSMPTMPDLTIEYATPERVAIGNPVDFSIDYEENTPQELIELDQEIRRYANANKLNYQEAFKIIAQGAVK